MARTAFLTILLFLSGFSTLAFGQEGMKAFEQGYEAHRNKDYEKALRFYDRAIELNDTLDRAYFNRASVRIALKRYEKAKEDLDRTLELDPEYVPAYYNRANLHSEQGNYQKAHSDLNATLELKPDHRQALLLRGQVRQHLGKGQAGCSDLKKARELGVKKASRYLERYCSGPGPLDLEARWPKRDEWKVIHRNETERQKRIELVPKGEDAKEWQHLGNLTALKFVQGIPMDTARFLLTKQTEGKCKKVRSRTLEKRDQGPDSYIFFELNCKAHINTREPETQLWYVEQGRRHLYAYFVAVRKKRMNRKERKKWMDFFR